MKRIVLFIISLSIIGVTLYAQQNIHNFPISTKTAERLFYIQRSLNSNTIVYDVNYDSKGLINEEQPVNVYWIRYEENAITMPLRKLEKWLAFGVKTEKLPGGRFDYQVRLAALDDRWFFIQQTKPYQCSVYIKHKNTFVALDHIYVNSDPDNYLSAVESVELYGGNYKPSSSLIETIKL